MTLADTATSTPAASIAEYTEVAPSAFVSSTGHHLLRFTSDAAPGHSAVGLCYFDTESVACTGTAAAAIPDITVAPFPPGRPGAIAASAEGLRYTMLEGVPPAERELYPEQRVIYGEIRCELSAERFLTCAHGENSFTIAGAELTITTDGTVVSDAPQTTAPQTTAGADDLPQGPGAQCADGAGGTPIEIREGETTCVEARSVIAEYRARRDTEGGGNTLAMVVGAWSCAAPTAMRSQEINAAETCSRLDDTVTIAVPLV